MAVPVLIAMGAAIYSAQLSLHQAADQEARAQAGADAAVDAELADAPAVVARVRPVDEANYVYVFPTALDEATVKELAGPSRRWYETEGRSLPAEQVRAILDRLDERRRETGGFTSSYDYIDDVKKSTSKHLVSLIGNRREKIRVTDFRVNIIHKSPAPRGTLLLFYSEGGVPVERIAVDLDDPTSTPLLVPEDGENIKPYLDARSLTLDRGEEVGLELTAYSEEFHYQWEIELHIAYGDVEHEKVIIRSDGTSNGRPFDTVAWDAEHTYVGGTYIRDNSTYELVRLT